MHIGEIVTPQGEVISKEENIGAKVVNFFSRKFQEEDYEGDYSMINNIRRLITIEENKEMERLADECEVKSVVFDLNGNSACGPDGFTGELF